MVRFFRWIQDKKPVLKQLLQIALTGGLYLSAAPAADDLARDFSRPPDSARPYAFWYWVNGHITREGITADLEGMKQAGLGGVMIFNIGKTFPAGPVRCTTPEWREMMKHAIREAARLGLEVNLNNSSAGWSGSGGPWITPELAMKKLTWSETRIQGRRHVAEALPAPPAIKECKPEFFEPAKKLDWYRDVAVLAFPTPEAEKENPKDASVTASDPECKVAALLDRDETTVAGLKGQPPTLQFEFTSPFPARALELRFKRGGAAVQGGTLFASDDGMDWRKVRAFEVRNEMPVSAPFESAPARFWKIDFTVKGGAAPIQLTEARLLPGYRIEDWTGKAVFDWIGIDKPQPPAADATAPSDCVIPRGQIIDLTSRLKPDGTLDWDAPPGDWTVLRFGYTLTGQITGTTPAAGGAGLEGDKFSTEAVDAHWKNSLQPFWDDKEIDEHVKFVHSDSYEMGAQNWSADFPAQFRDRRGYDLIPWLPVMTGRVVGNLDQSERFLWDLRHVISGLIADNYFGRLRDLTHESGKELTIEPYHQEQFDSVTVGGIADVPMAEIWMGESVPSPFWTKLGASPAHVYGKKIVQCESFTSNLILPDGGNWSKSPWDLKSRGDLMLCGGINRIVMHVSTLQPWSNVVPGMTVGPCGQHFDRGNTWWSRAGGLTTYLARCQHLLTQGKFVADVLYSCGENSPSKSIAPEGLMKMPKGYDYDVCDPKVILTRLAVKDSRLVLPDGMSYRVLVLPGGDTMTPLLLRKIRSLVEAGATVIGPKPSRANGLVGFPEANDEIRKMADEIWGPGDPGPAGEHAFGLGRVIWGRELKNVLAGLGIKPDMATPPAAPLIYIHRQLEDGGDLYFVSNQSLDQLSVDCEFRTAGNQPELWDPRTGEMRELPDFQSEDGSTKVPLRFEPRESYFVVFRKPSETLEGPALSGPSLLHGRRHSGRSSSNPAEASSEESDPMETNFPESRTVQEITGPWTVAFDPKLGGPPLPVAFDTLQDWTSRPEPGIKYYSGTATYRKSFDCPLAGSGQRIFLDLGKVQNLAAVKLNGRDLGIVWCAPWTLEITDDVKLMDNALEIEVVNLWPNRLIGDEQLPEDYERNPNGSLKFLPDWLLKNTARTSGRITFATYNTWKKDDPLLPSGLLGPVTIREVVASEE